MLCGGCLKWGVHEQFLVGVELVKRSESGKMRDVKDDEK